MSLRVGWNFGSTADSECQDVVMQDLPSWTATSAVLKVGRGLSSWLISNVSPPSSPLGSSFFGKPCFANERFSYTRSSIQGVTANPSPPSPTFPFISNLPHELLEVIFWEYLYGRSATSPSLKDSLQGSYRRIKTLVGTTTTPFTLAHVCSSWRAVVMFRPFLWSKLCAFRPEAHDIPLLEFWISQSSSCPLDLTVVERGVEEMEAVDATAHQVLLLAFQQSDRLRKVALHLQQDMECVFTSSSAFPPLPLLESIILDIGDWSTEGYQATAQLLSHSPVLRGAAWGMWCPISPFISDTPWTNLLTIKFGLIDLYDLDVILPLASSLQSLSIDSLVMDNTALSSLTHRSTIELPQLSSLVLESYRDPSPLFDVLCTPSLTSITLHAGVGRTAASDAGWASLTRLVQRSGCRVSSLDWQHIGQTDEATVESVEVFNARIDSLFPDLCHLRIGSPVGSRTIDAFTARPESQSSTLPSLQSLELRDCNAGIDSVEAMIASRPKLRSIDIKLRYDTGQVRHVFSDTV